jgi:hypothetical protein
VFNVFDSEIYAGGIGNPARKFHVGFGYDPEIYIATAGLVSSPYLTQALCAAKLGGTNRLIAALDDSKPPVGTLSPNNPQNNPVVATLNNLIQIVTTEINGYLSSIYPIPLAQTGTVSVIQVTAVSTDGLNSITAIDVVEPGNYCTAPVANQFPVYLRQIDPIDWKRLEQNIVIEGGGSPYLCQSGTGANLTVTYASVNYSDESGQTLEAQQVTGTPAIVSGGQNYQIGDLLVLTGGSSFVPAKIRQAALEIFYYECYKRRLAPDEKNPGEEQAKFWRKLLVEIQEGERQLDGTFKRFYAATSSWNVESVLNGANSL